MVNTKKHNMKIKIIIAFVLVNQTFFISCKKENDSCNLIPAKLIRSDCDRVIFQIISSDIIGDTNWTDVRTGLHYSNVVAYSNTCKISHLTNGVVDTLYVRPVKISEREINPDCIQCHAISDNPPLTNVDFLNISLTSCDSNQNK
jgi:hypothetical protein